MDLRKRLGMRRSPWDNKRLLYMVRRPTLAEAETIPAEFDGLAEYCPCLGDQGDIGDCGGWAGKAVMHAITFLNDRREINFSAGSIYEHSRDYVDPPIPSDEEGTTALGVMKFLADKGADTEECAPTPSQEPLQFVECANWQDIAKDFKIPSYHQVLTDQASLQAAIMGITFPQPYTMPDGSPGKAPLFITLDVYQSIEPAASNGGLVPLPQPGDPLQGSHAIELRGWKQINGQYYWIFVNSWGLSVGNHGVYYFPYGYPVAEAWLINVGAPVPGPEPAPIFTPSPCKVGNTVAQLMNIGPALLGRKGRFQYLNSPRSKP